MNMVKAFDPSKVSMPPSHWWDAARRGPVEAGSPASKLRVRGVRRTADRVCVGGIPGQPGCFSAVRLPGRRIDVAIYIDTDPKTVADGLADGGWDGVWDAIYEQIDGVPGWAYKAWGLVNRYRE